MREVTFLKSRLGFKGGLEKYTLFLAKHFEKNNFKVTILTTSSSLPALKNVDVINLGKSSKFTLLHLIKFDFLCNKWLSKHPQKLIFGLERNSFQTHYRLGSGVHAVFLKRRMETESPLKKFSLVLNPLHYYLLYLEKKALENPKLQKLFVNSQMVKDEVLKHYSIDESKIKVIYNGVEWKELEKPFLEQFTPKKKKELLFVGNGYKRKGLQFLFPSLAKMDHDFHLSVVGKEKNINYFQKLAFKYGLENKVTFFGHQNNVLPFYQKADIFVLPTVYDPFANATLEALALGLFVVTSAYNGAKEVISETNGVVIENLFNVDDIKRSLEKAFGYTKTYESALPIRNSISHLEFSSQLDKIVESVQ